MTPGTNPAATYRLQFNADFRLENARSLLDYLSRLGATHLYSSPLLRPRQGSTHGYDVVDPAQLNPEIGDDNEFRGLVDELNQRGMGLILDIVPNHMAAVDENPYWDHVLAYGPDSPYARWFDIDFRLPDPELWGRVLVPVLGETLQRVLEENQLKIVLREGGFRVAYFEHTFPINPATLAPILAFSLRKLEECFEPGHPTLRELGVISRELRALPRGPGRTRRGEQPLHQLAQDPLARLAELIRGERETRPAFAEAAEAFCSGSQGQHRLRRLLDLQCYRLAYWRRAARVLNYRRFFDINDLVAVRQEDPQVFDETHALVVAWSRQGLLHGLRIDHVDGLRDPLGYLLWLAEATPEPQARSGRIALYAEKILGHDERLRECWPVSGTTGYDFLNQVEAIFISPQGAAEIDQQYRNILRRPIRFKNVAFWAKRRVLRAELSAFVGQLTRILFRVAQNQPESAALTYPELVEAIVEVVVCLPVYRTYIDDRTTQVHESDRHYIETALAGARWRQRATPEALDFLADVLLLERLSELPENERQERLSFIERFQQLSGPAAAKGIEDTALYVYVPLVSRNEVGGEPDTSLEQAVAELHRANQQRAQRSPQAMLAATTHDTKRSADVRSRLDVLSELPKLWAGHLNRWRRLNRPHRNRVGGRLAPDSNTEYLLYQTMLGIWPARRAANADRDLPEPETIAELRDRVEEYMLKAAREMKTRTSWVHTNADYEEALVTFVRSLFLPVIEPWSDFLRDLNQFVARIARPGLWNALSRTLIQLTAPGTPDIYQGDELWNFCLVDPDNRRPVDFELRRRLLGEICAARKNPHERLRQFVADIVANPEDGRIKLHVFHAALEARKTSPAVFAAGQYQPLEVEGPLGAHVFAFVRSADAGAAITVVPRLTATLVDDPASAPVGYRVWSDTRIRLSEALRGLRWNSAMTGDIVSDEGSTLSVADILAEFPVALLVAGNTLSTEPPQ